MTKYKTPRWGWALTGSGHFLKESLTLVRDLEDVDLFLSRAADEVLRMYKQELGLPRSTRTYHDTPQAHFRWDNSTMASITP